MKKTINVAVCFLMLALFILHEYMRYEVPGSNNIRTLLKFSLSLVSVLILTIVSRSLDSKQKVIYYGLLVCIVGDVVINHSSVGGMFLYMLAQCVLIYGFILRNGMNRKKTGIWLAASVLAIAIGLSTGGASKMGTIMFVGGIIYIGLFIMMVVSAWGDTIIVKGGACFFGLSDALLIYNLLVGDNVARHVISLGTYYIGITLISAGIFWELSSRGENE